MLFIKLLRKLNKHKFFTGKTDFIISGKYKVETFTLERKLYPFRDFKPAVKVSDGAELKLASKILLWVKHTTLI